MVVIAAGAGAWIAMRPAVVAHDDCQTVREMLDYSRSESNRLIATGIDTVGEDPQKVVGDYTTWAQKVREYADQIQDPTLHDTASALASADSDFVGVWSNAALHPQPASTDVIPSSSDRALTQQYSQFSDKQRTLTADLLGKCP
jgi:hypothetical protein